MKGPAATVSVDRENHKVIVVLERAELTLAQARDLAEALEAARLEAQAAASPTWTI